MIVYNKKLEITAVKKQISNLVTYEISKISMLHI